MCVLPSLLVDLFEPLFLPVMMHFIYVRRYRMYIRRRRILLVLHFEPWPDYLEGALVLDQVSGCEPMKL